MILEKNEHPIERIMDNALTKIRSFVDANTIIGKPIETSGGVTIIPISKVAMGFVTGGGEYSDLSRENYNEYPFAGGSGAGVSVSPIGFLIGDCESIKFVRMDDKDAFEQIIEVIPKLVNSIFGGKEN